MSIVQRAVTFGRMIKFSHSVFALPFAFVSGLVALESGGMIPTWVEMLLLLLCMVCARTAAMGFNRIADRDIDSLNPRTSSREIPSGRVAVGEATAFTVAAVVIFIVASFAINPLCGILAFPLLALLLGYSLTKRYTAAVHFVLGACLGMAPVGVWFALTSGFSWIPILLGLGVTFWTAGFDIYYSCQDEGFDKAQGLKSIPARIGAMSAIRLVRPIHALAVLFYILFGVAAGMGPIFFAGLAAVVGILVYEAWILRKGDLTRIDLAFFNLNGYVSVLFAAASLVDLWIR